MCGVLHENDEGFDSCTRKFTIKLLWSKEISVEVGIGRKKGYVEYLVSCQIFAKTETFEGRLMCVAKMITNNIKKLS